MLSVRRTRNSVRRTLVSTVKFISEAAGGFQSLTIRQVSDGCYHIRQVLRAATNSHQVHEHAELVDNAEPDRNLIGSQCWLWRTGVMWSRVPACSCNKFGGPKIVDIRYWLRANSWIQLTCGLTVDRDTISVFSRGSNFSHAVLLQFFFISSPSFVLHVQDVCICLYRNY